MIKNLVPFNFLILYFFLILPSFYYIDNYEYFNLKFSYLDFFYYSFLSLIIFSVLNFFFFFKKIYNSEKVFILLIFFIIMLTLSNFFINLTYNIIELSVLDSKINRLNFIFTILCSIFLTYLFYRYKFLINFFLLTIFFTFIYQNIFFFINKYESIIINNDLNFDKKKTFSISENENLFIVSFEGVSGRMMKKLITEEDNFFENFIFFPNTISQGSHTQSSMLGEIYGTMPFKKYGDGIDEIITNLNNNHNFENNLIYDYYDNHIIGNFYSDILKNDNYEKINFYQHYQYSSSVKYYIDLISIIQCKQALCFDKRFIFSNLFHYLSYKFNLDNLSTVGHALLWQQIYDDFINNLNIDTKLQNKLITIHFNQTHNPPGLNKDCTIAKYQDFLINYSNDGAYLNAQCTYENIKKFITKLKKIGTFDNSTIVLKSDHGYGPEFYEDSPYNLGIKNNPNIGIDRYNPFILIKQKNHINSKFKIISNQVLINDIPKTLCLLKNSLNKCKRYEGVDLFNYDDQYDNGYFIYIPKNENSNHDLVNSIETKIKSRDIILSEWLISNELIKIN